MNNYIRYLFTFSFLISNYSVLLSQSIPEPIYNSSIYKFLDRHPNKGLIPFFDDIRLVTRLTIAEKLIILEKKESNLTKIEKRQLDFYKSEYAFELKYISKDSTELNEFFKFGKTNRFNLFKYYSKNFTMKIDPVFLIKYDFVKKSYH